MRIGQCPSCARAYTAGEVTGMGILRSRAASRGGPLMEFACPGCGHRFTLLPHGQGRYARPGEPPPPPVPEAERAPPWQRGSGRPRTAPREEARRTEPPPEPPPAPEEPIDIHEPPPEEGERPLTVPEAYALLEIPPTADREAIERAYRLKSRTCHPDKVAHLDPEFQELAERKFRRLRGAYELLIP